MKSTAPLAELPGFLPFLLRFILLSSGFVGLSGCAAPHDRTAERRDNPAERAPASRAVPAEIEVLSLLGQPLKPLRDSPRQAELLADLAQAQARLQEEPDNPDAHIWVARRLGYLWRMNAAIDILSRAIERWPDNPALYRHRGHRYLSVRNIAAARSDLETAAELAAGLPDQVEPDGQPNAAGVALTTLKSNIFYHLGLAQYLSGAYSAAAAAFTEAEKLGRGYDDNQVSTGYWRYLSLMRLATETSEIAVAEEARRSARLLLEGISPELELLENRAYHRLLLYYKGVMSEDELRIGLAVRGVDSATIGYGAGVYRYIAGDPEAARQAWVLVCEGPAWPAFGHLAAEVELSRMACGRRGGREGGGGKND